MPGALAGLRVLELGDFAAAPFCARILGDLGADVIKVEPPHGDSARLYGPFAGDIPDPERSGLFLYLNSNKRGITLDYGSPDGRTSLDALLTHRDILVVGAGTDGRLATELDLAEIHQRPLRTPGAFRSEDAGGFHPSQGQASSLTETLQTRKGLTGPPSSPR